MVRESRTRDLWNSVPQRVMDAPSTNAFQAVTDTILISCGTKGYEDIRMDESGAGVGHLVLKPPPPFNRIMTDPTATSNPHSRILPITFHPLDYQESNPLPP